MQELATSFGCIRPLKWAALVNQLTNSAHFSVSWFDKPCTVVIYGKPFTLHAACLINPVTAEAAAPFAARAAARQLAPAPAPQLAFPEAQAFRARRAQLPHRTRALPPGRPSSARRAVKRRALERAQLLQTRTSKLQGWRCGRCLEEQQQQQQRRWRRACRQEGVRQLLLRVAQALAAVSSGLHEALSQQCQQAQDARLRVLKEQEKGRSRFRR